VVGCRHCSEVILVVTQRDQVLGCGGHLAAHCSIEPAGPVETAGGLAEVQAVEVVDDIAAADDKYPPGAAA
jgi:hypothetical protein